MWHPRAAAGLLKLSEEGLHLTGKRVVCVIAGVGLKGTDFASELEPVDLQEYPGELEAVERAPAVE